MKKNTRMKFGAALVACTMLFAGCSSSSNNTDTSTSSTDKSSTTDKSSSTASTDKNTSTGSSSSSASSSTTTTNSDTTSTDDEETKDDDIDIDATEISTSGTINLSDYSGPVKITAAGTYTITGSGSMVIVDAKKQDVTLILDNVTLKNDSMPCLYIKKASNVTLKVTGDNTMTMGSNYTYDSLNACLYSKADLVLEGDGTLTLSSGYEHGIKAKDTLTVNGGTYNITAQNDGIHVNEVATFNDGNFTINASGEGIESKDTMEINGGTYYIKASDDAINAINALTINDGTITAISATNDGIDSNGDLIINGGTVSAFGLKTPEQAFDVDNTPFEINGGTVYGLGSSAAYPSNCDQPVIMIGGSGSVSTVEIKDASGNTVASCTTPDGVSSSSNSVTITVSSPNLSVGSTYTVYVNGSEYSSVTLSSTVTTLGNVQTMGGGGMQGGMRGGSMGGRR